MLTAKTVMPEKFWILEGEDGQRRGTLRVVPDGVSIMLDGKEHQFGNINKACWDLSINIQNTAPVVEEAKEENVMGYPTRCEAFNPGWDVKRKLPIFTKSDKSRTLHAAGYYIIHFANGWVHSFCPKVSTLEANEFQGPYKDKLEMREQLRKAQNKEEQ